MPLTWWSRSPWPRLVTLAVVLGAAGVFTASNGQDAVPLLRTWVDGLGPFGPVAFVLLHAVACSVFLPLALLAAVAGVLFGPVWAVPLVWAGSMLGALGSFLLGRGLSRQAVEQLAGARMDRINALVSRHGALAVFLLRQLPAGPFALLNYLASATSLRLRGFLLGNGFGILPGVIVYSSLGGSVGDPTSPEFLIACGALLVLIVGGALAIRRVSLTGEQ